MTRPASKRTAADARAVLVISNRSELRSQLADRLKSLALDPFTAQSGAEALQILESRNFGAVVLDERLPDLDPDSVAEAVAGSHGATDILWIGPRSQVSNKQPFKQASTTQIANAIKEFALSAEANAASSGSDSAAQELLPGIYGSSEVMQKVAYMATLIAPRDTAVLLTGETGTGKDALARAIHSLSKRAGKPFVVVNCAAVPETLMESELFGHARGAFTGAVQSRPGRLQAANGGTLLLDEVGELSPGMQAKLLRFLQDGELQRLGGDGTERVDARVIAATNSDIASAPPEKPFRRDLYYRLAVFPIELPLLRARGEDVVELAGLFLSDICRKEGRPQRRLSDEFRGALLKHDWPGNIRELQHVIERAHIFAQDENVLTEKHLSPYLQPLAH
jgi:DNA-binding NtrC family response regulator